ncbi:MAG: HRDC domain-containing protein [Planctomycetota bacterium]
MDSDSRCTQLRLLTLQFAPSLGGFDTRALDTFLADKELLDLREHFFVVRELPYLACLITYRTVAARGAATEAPPARKGRIDLSTEERVLFETLRTWRRERAHQDGVPPYVLFTDRELAGLVRARPTSRSALGSVPGVGQRKVERYGEALLRLFGVDGDCAPTAEPSR